VFGVVGEVVVVVGTEAVGVAVAVGGDAAKGVDRAWEIYYAFLFLPSFSLSLLFFEAAHYNEDVTIAAKTKVTMLPYIKLRNYRGRLEPSGTQCTL
jgi:hypothetical protein